MSKRFTHIDQFTSDAVKFAGAAAGGDAVAGQTVNIDYVAPFDLVITGAVVIVKNAKIDDLVSLQVVHPQAGVLDTFVTDWYVSETSDEQFALQLNYPANIPAGLILRAVYKANGTLATRQVRINYLLHKVIE
jgi:hypothetical protein